MVKDLGDRGKSALPCLLLRSWRTVPEGFRHEEEYHEEAECDDNCDNPAKISGYFFAFQVMSSYQNTHCQLSA